MFMADGMNVKVTQDPYIVWTWNYFHGKSYHHISIIVDLWKKVYLVWCFMRTRYSCLEAREEICIQMKCMYSISQQVCIVKVGGQNVWNEHTL